MNQPGVTDKQKDIRVGWSVSSVIIDEQQQSLKFLDIMSPHITMKAFLMRA